MKPIYIGNVAQDGRTTRGWFVGHFIQDTGSIRHSNDVEVKWHEHQKGESREDWSVSEVATTLSLVVRGQMRMIFENKEFVLQAGDYCIAPCGTPHKYSIEEDSTILTIRWPSLPDDHRNVADE